MGFFARLLDVFGDLIWGAKFSVIVLALGIVTALDYYTGYYLSFSVFYAIPVSLASWGFGKWFGITVAAIAAFIWVVIGFSTALIGFDIEVHVWNFLIRFGFLALLASILAEVHDRVDNEEKLADTDSLTNLFNKRFFSERLEEEYYRAKRYGHPISVAYLDLDNFKPINDKFGHAEGDRVLRTVSDKISATARQTDLVARIGGDEFALVFFETGYEGAGSAFRKIQSEVNEAMKENGWDVTLSIGAITFTVLPEDIGEITEEADTLMYEVKRSGKNNMVHEHRDRVAK